MTGSRSPVCAHSMIFRATKSLSASVRWAKPRMRHASSKAVDIAVTVWESNAWSCSSRYSGIAHAPNNAKRVGAERAFPVTAFPLVAADDARLRNGSFGKIQFAAARGRTYRQCRDAHTGGGGGAFRPGVISRLFGLPSAPALPAPGRGAGTQCFSCRRVRRPPPRRAGAGCRGRCLAGSRSCSWCCSPIAPHVGVSLACVRTLAEGLGLLVQGVCPRPRERLEKPSPLSRRSRHPSRRRARCECRGRCPVGSRACSWSCFHRAVCRRDSGCCVPQPGSAVGRPAGLRAVAGRDADHQDSIAGAAGLGPDDFVAGAAGLGAATTDAVKLMSGQFPDRVMAGLSVLVHLAERPILHRCRIAVCRARAGSVQIAEEVPGPAGRPVERPEQQADRSSSIRLGLKIALCLPLEVLSTLTETGPPSGSRWKTRPPTEADLLMAVSFQPRGEGAMGVKLDVGNSRFPAVTWVDADKRGKAVNLIFGTRLEGQGAALRIALTSSQWENLKFLVDGPTPGGCD